MIILKAKIQQTVGDKVYIAEACGDEDSVKDIEKLVMDTKYLLKELIER